jgi:hypothetical protein
MGYQEIPHAFRPHSSDTCALCGLPEDDAPHVPAHPHAVAHLRPTGAWRGSRASSPTPSTPLAGVRWRCPRCPNARMVLSLPATQPPMCSCGEAMVDVTEDHA